MKPITQNQVEFILLELHKKAGADVASHIYQDMRKILCDILDTLADLPDDTLEIVNDDEKLEITFDSSSAKESLCFTVNDGCDECGMWIDKTQVMQVIKYLNQVVDQINAH